MLAREDLHQEIAKLREQNEGLLARVRFLEDRIEELLRPPENSFPREWRLTRSQARLLDCLYGHPFVSTGTLHLALYRGSEPQSLEKIVSVQVCKMRQKLPRGSIETVWGDGYRLSAVGRAFVAGALREQTAEQTP